MLSRPLYFLLQSFDFQDFTLDLNFSPLQASFKKFEVRARVGRMVDKAIGMSVGQFVIQFDENLRPFTPVKISLN